MDEKWAEKLAWAIALLLIVFAVGYIRAQLEQPTVVIDVVVKPLDESTIYFELFTHPAYLSHQYKETLYLMKGVAVKGSTVSVGWVDGSLLGYSGKCYFEPNTFFLDKTKRVEVRVRCEEV